MKTLLFVLLSIIETILEVAYTISQYLFVGLGLTLGVYCGIAFILRLFYWN